jgi:predicted RNase H-like HicB family nuclease
MRDFGLVIWREHTGEWMVHIPIFGDLHTFGPTREAAIDNARTVIAGHIAQWGEEADREGRPEVLTITITDEDVASARQALDEST